MENTFIYGHKGCHIDYNGMGFDSLLELRYAISIQDEYAFLRESIKIFYDPIAQTSTNYLREGIKKYTPDFLICNLATRKAYLLEVKLHAFDDFCGLTLLQNICDRYIATGQYYLSIKLSLSKIFSWRLNNGSCTMPSLQKHNQKPATNI